jgi:hypothetical protein
MQYLTKFIVVAAAAVPAVAFGYTLSGTIPPGRAPVRLELHRPLPHEIRLTFYAPPSPAGVPYALNYCLGPASNPCGLPSDRVWVVAEGKSITAVVSATELKTKVLVVGQGTSKPVPYKVQVS